VQFYRLRTVCRHYIANTAIDYESIVLHVKCSILRIAAYIEELAPEIARPSVKQHLAAIPRCSTIWWRDASFYPPRSSSGQRPVRGHARQDACTAGYEMRQLLRLNRYSKLIGLRDRALLRLVGYTFAGVRAVVTLLVEGYFQQGLSDCVGCQPRGRVVHKVHSPWDRLRNPGCGLMDNSPSFQAGSGHGGLHGVLSRSMALRMVSILRRAAINAAFLSIPRASKRW
jgi:hypothetical protein